MAIAAEGGSLPVPAVRGQCAVGTQIEVAAVGGGHGEALIRMNGHLPGGNRPVVDAAQAAARGVYLMQHGLRSGRRKRGVASAEFAACRGRRNAVNGMSAAAGRSYWRIVPRREGIVARNGWGWWSAGVDVLSGRGRRCVSVGVRSGRGCRCIACAAGGGMGSVCGNPVIAPHICPVDGGVAGSMGCIGNAGSVGVRGISSGARRGMRARCVPARWRTRRIAMHRGRWTASTLRTV